MQLTIFVNLFSHFLLNLDPKLIFGAACVVGEICAGVDTMCVNGICSCSAGFIYQNGACGKIFLTPNVAMYAVSYHCMEGYHGHSLMCVIG